MPIRILSPEVASQIAAGEVIERPASVVKELLENSLDAGASQITINIENAGKRLIEISDNGSGIVSGELSIAVTRHATSKLSSSDDLFRITTLGFRGEALASIGSVARLTLISCAAGDNVGARLVVEGGRIGILQTVGVPEGTVVRVEDLFYNVPARLKFLKSDMTERRQIDLLVTRYALAYPQTRFSLFQDGRPVLQTSGNGDRREVLAALYGVDVARNMLELTYEDSGINITGFISPTSLTRSNRREITLFVNGRPIQDVSLASAVVQAYHTLLMVGRYPLAILFIHLAPEDVDVNVHPTKAEVRFKDPSRMFATIQQATRRALLAHTPVPGFAPDHSLTPQNQHWPSWTDEFASTPDRDGPDFTAEAHVPVPDEPYQPRFAHSFSPILRLVGQVAATYLVAEGPDGLYLIDQHAAHERVLFEKYISQFKETIPAQALLQPIKVEISPASTNLVNDQLSLLDRLGFKVEPFGPGMFILRTIPVMLSGMDPAAALYVLVEDFEEDETPLQAVVEAKIIARVCKRAAIKSGQVLTIEEQRALLADLEACQSPRTCPHGRPTMIHLSVDLLERQFGRRGAR
ncbi:MAG TPA: DNA mismatch repair endonuclease MutL [Anaerolineales bacterium]|nr:DNA mismatch repair endonuclease MutL [Anaerolineales bacterium]